MLALSIRQPWATAIFNGKKIDIRTRFPVGAQPLVGETILIHTGKVPWEGWEFLDSWDTSEFKKHSFWIYTKNLPNGVILGEAEFAGVKRYSNKKEFAFDEPFHWNNPNWFEGCPKRGLVGLEFGHTSLFKNPIPFKGRLGFFKIDPDMIFRSFLNRKN